MRPFKSTFAQKKKKKRFCPSPPLIPACSSRPPPTSKHYSHLKFAEVMQSSLSQISITIFQSKTYKTVILTCTLSLFALIIFSDDTISKPEFSTCATFLEPPCHVKKRGFHILLQDIFLICFSTQNNENKFFIF